MPTRIKSFNAQMGNLMNDYLHHHRNDAIIMTHWLMAMASRVRITLENKDVVSVITQDHAITIMTMRTTTNNLLLNTSIFIVMSAKIVMNITSIIAQMVDAMNALLRHHLTLEIAETLGLPYGMRKNAYAIIAKAKTMVHENVPISRVQYAMAMVT